MALKLQTQMAIAGPRYMLVKFVQQVEDDAKKWLMKAEQEKQTVLLEEGIIGLMQYRKGFFSEQIRCTHTVYIDLGQTNYINQHQRLHAAKSHCFNLDWAQCNFRRGGTKLESRARYRIASNFRGEKISWKRLKSGECSFL